jgi:hypothetical protein
MSTPFVRPASFFYSFWSKNFIFWRVFDQDFNQTFTKGHNVELGIFFSRYRVRLCPCSHQKVSYKHNVRTTILRSRSISAQSWVMLWTPHSFVRFLLLFYGGVVFWFPNNLEKNLNKSFRKSGLFSHILMKLTLMFYNGTRSLLILRSNYQFKKNQQV